MLLPDAIILGQVFLQCLDVLGFHFLLSLENLLILSWVLVLTSGFVF